MCFIARHPCSVLSARFAKGEVVVHVDADDRRFRIYVIVISN